ncbi:MAG: methyltransferase domain-containing protein [Rhodospirillaceae bacterium]|jgi:predicted SAM-dependent methyltransferase|nr:methyltransferase domain-containing protein [Rhodospirillaceae bacterium]MBT5665154.1 methyltransferase domain-containing protein [Rhodospirillaceae bacterium]MBT5811829.1 methyltransferase domain-containing protein [Rhodospirillaceae bacterium]
MISTGPQAASSGGGMQAPFDAAVIIPTILRDTLMRAVRSVFAQDHPGRVQILIGVDVARGDRDMLRQLSGECPERMAITVFDPGYSTAQVHGGIYPNAYSGSLRTVMSYAANSTRIAYLDDDNWWAPHHLSELLNAINGFDWAFSFRWFVDAGTHEVLCVDDFESLGPERGIFKTNLGGFVDANCMMIDKTKCHGVLPQWSIPLLDDGTGEDRNVFNALKANHSLGWTGRPSVYYTINPQAGPQPVRDKLLAERGLKTSLPPQGTTARYAHRDARINEYLLSNLTRKLHLGAGPNILDGWLNTDIAPQTSDVMAINVTAPLPFEAGTFDFVYSEHMIEHLTLEQGIRVVKELFRITRPGAIIRMATPDLEKILALFTKEPSATQQKYVDWTTKTFIGAIEGYNPTLVLNNMFYNWGHRFIYEPGMLAAIMRNAGFTDLKSQPVGRSDHAPLNNIENHGGAIGAPDMAAYETMAIEARRP